MLSLQGQKYENFVLLCNPNDNIRTALSPMNVEAFIARRIAHPSPGSRPGVMERIAVVSVALSLAVMTVALAVIMGFKSEISSRMSGLGAHITVTAAGSDPASPSPVVRSAATERAILSAAGVRSIRAFDARGGVIRNDGAMQGIVLKGIDGGYEGTFFGQMLVEGELPRTGGENRTKDVLLSRTTADLVAVRPGDKVEMIFLSDDGGARRDRFRVSGIYSTGMEEMEALALTDIRNVGRLSGRDSSAVAGYEVTAGDFRMLDDACRAVNAALDAAGDDTLVARSITELHPNIFDWLRTHDVNAAVIIVVMLTVALFNMVTALLIIVLERTRMIGILRALGMTGGALQRLFLYRSAAIVAKGLLPGNIAGIGLCLVQMQWHVMKLDSAGYLLSEVPVSLSIGWIAALNAGAAAVIVAAMFLPARFAARIRPEQSIRYE